MAPFQSYIIAGGSSRFLQDAVVLPTQYSVGCWEKTWRGHSKLKIKAVQSELMKVGEDSPASTDAFSLYLKKKVMRGLSKECESVVKDPGEKCILLRTPTAAVRYINN